MQFPSFHQYRTPFNVVVGFIAAPIACWSIWLAFNRAMLEDPRLEPVTLLEKLHLAFWIFVPPLFFWIDWVFFCNGLQADEREIAKHTHDLSRNIWLALVAILGYVVIGKV